VIQATTAPALVRRWITHAPFAAWRRQSVPARGLQVMSVVRATQNRNS